MKFERPAATLEKVNPTTKEKDLPNMVKITNKAIDPENNKDGVIFTFNASEFEYPQVESHAEFYEFCGGEDKALVIINGFIRDDSLKAGKDKIRLSETGSEDDIKAAGLAETRNFNYLITSTISAAEAKQKFSDLRMLAQDSTLTPEQLAEKVRAMFGA